MYQRYFKRLFDITISLTLIILLSPIFIIVFFLVWLFIGFPIFLQKRPGLNNKIFTIYKFKTLYADSNNISDKKRKNIIGNFLRRFGIDELPQLFNILKNDMSFVGPRPLLPKYLKIKGFREHKRKKCKPGITGLAQINNFTKSKIKRRKSKWIVQFNLDEEYSRNISFKLDIFILFKTFLKIFFYEKVDYYNETRLTYRQFK